ncbi:MAG TPA: LLM class flavin-dependent oxidoreductase [Myxococcota bacterium]|nr:LLM class flavin-dependent oxidoreductase [Myxococcota bacterium]
MRLSCGFPPTASAPEHAALAEELGYERVWFYDSPALYGDVWVALARAADATRRIGLGTAVLVPNLRHVVATAAAIGTIEELAPGRLVVALGTGFTGRMVMGQKPLSWKFVERYVTQLRGLLAGEEVEVEGRACKLIHPEGFLAKRPIATPIAIAANGAKGIEVAKRLGTGVMCAGVVPTGARDARYLAFGTALDPGEKVDSPRVLAAIGGAIAVVYHGTYEAGGAAVDNLTGGRGWREEIERFPAGSRHLHVHEGHCVEANAIDRRHMSPALAGVTFTGTPDELRQRAAGLATQGVGEIVYAPMGPDLPRELRAMKAALGG